jgi:hypothetical protein
MNKNTLNHGSSSAEVIAITMPAPTAGLTSLNVLNAGRSPGGPPPPPPVTNPASASSYTPAAPPLGSRGSYDFVKFTGGGGPHGATTGVQYVQRSQPGGRSGHSYSYHLSGGSVNERVLVHLYPIYP